MTPIYKVWNENTGKIVTKTSSLHAACKAIVGQSALNVIRGTALVAHWYETVRPGFGADPTERKQIEADRGIY